MRFHSLFQKVKALIVRRPSRTAIFVLGGVLAIGCLIPFLTSAQDIGAGDKFVVWLVQWVLYPIVRFLANVLIVVINILIGVAQYNDFIHATAVEKGWVIVRDLCNMFFIIVLLVIAFGTILKIETYRYNRLLGKLILYAFLINFSKFIAGFWIDIGQVVMLTFVNGFKDAAAGNLASGLGMADMLTLVKNGDPGDINSSSLFNAILLAIALLIIAVIVVLIMTLILLLRVLTLWFLIVLSPIAFITRIFPNTAKYSDQWWGEFNKQIIVGPVMAFFLWLALTIIAFNGPTSTNYGFKQVSKAEQAALISGAEGRGAGVARSVAAAVTEISQSDRLLSYMISIGMLLGALQAAQQVGGAGGKLAGAWSEKIRTGGLTAAGLLTGVAAARFALRGARGGARKLAGTVARETTMRVPMARLATKKYWEGFWAKGKELQEEADRVIVSKGKSTRDRWDYVVLKGKPGNVMPARFENTVTAMRNEAEANAQKSLGRNPSTEKRVRQLKTAAARAKKGGLHEALDAAANLNMTAAAGNLDDRWADAVKSGEVTRENALSEWHADRVEQLFEGFEEEKAHVMMAYDLDIDRAKFDPIAIAHKMAMDQGGEDLRKKVWEAYFEQDDVKQKAAYNDPVVKKIIEDSRKARDAAVMRAGDLDQVKLRGLQEAAESSRNNGHDEQTVAVYDSDMGRAKMVDPLEQQKYVMDNLQKEPTQDVASKMVPHGLAHYQYDQEKRKFFAQVDPTKQSRLGKQKFQLARNFQDRDASRTAARYPQRALGVRGTPMVRDEDAILDRFGDIIPGREEMYQAAVARDREAYRFFYGRQFGLPAKGVVLPDEDRKKFTEQYNERRHKDVEYQRIVQQEGEADRGAWERETRSVKNDRGEEVQEEWETRTLQQEDGSVEKEERRVIPDEEKSERTQAMRDVMVDSMDGRKIASVFAANLPNDALGIERAIKEMTSTLNNVGNQLSAVTGQISHAGARNDVEKLAKALKQQQAAGRDTLGFIGANPEYQRTYFQRSEQILHDIEKAINSSTKEAPTVEAEGRESQPGASESKSSGEESPPNKPGAA